MDHLKALFIKYMDDSCTTAEIGLLMQHFTELENESGLRALVAAEMAKDEEEEADETLLDNRLLMLYSKLKPGLNGASQSTAAIRPMRSYLKYAVAAVVLIVVSATLYFYINPGRTNQHISLTAQHQGNDVGPGGNKAVLILADGSEISLTDVENGQLASQSGITITKTKDGELVYEIAKGKAAGAAEYNTISTPAGGQYQVNLPDGSKVWLNAMSSLKYPTVLNGTERKVTLSGEAYFEVAKNAAKPFIVSTNRAGKAQHVKVLGTHFNVNSYLNEEVTKTTLLEGSVKVVSGALAKTLKPGQQSILGSNLQVFDVDPTLATDWKNGNFYFNDENIESIMRKLSRWYDIDVVYSGNIPNINFGGEISRSKKLSEVLKVLETTRTIHFKIEGRRVTVMP